MSYIKVKPHTSEKVDNYIIETDSNIFIGGFISRITLNRRVNLSRNYYSRFLSDPSSSRVNSSIKLSKSIKAINKLYIEYILELFRMISHKRYYETIINIEDTKSEYKIKDKVVSDKEWYIILEDSQGSFYLVSERSRYIEEFKGFTVINLEEVFRYSKVSILSFSYDYNSIYMDPDRNICDLYISCNLEVRVLQKEKVVPRLGVELEALNSKFKRGRDLLISELNKEIHKLTKDISKELFKDNFILHQLNLSKNKVLILPISINSVGIFVDVKNNSYILLRRFTDSSNEVKFMPCLLGNVHQDGIICFGNAYMDDIIGVYDLEELHNSYFNSIFSIETDRYPMLVKDLKGTYKYLTNNLDLEKSEELEKDIDIIRPIRVTKISDLDIGKVQTIKYINGGEMSTSRIVIEYLDNKQKINSKVIKV